MRKIIARLVAVLVFILAAFVVYKTYDSTYFHKSISDFIEQGENFANNKPVVPEDVADTTTNGKFVHYIAIYWRDFQNLNNEMDAETTRMLNVFDAKNLQSDQTIATNLEKMNDYRALIQQKSDGIEQNVQTFIKNISSLDADDLKIGNISQVKSEVAKDTEFRQNIVDIRKTIASYMYAGLEFLQSRRQTLTFADNGAITFANPADQKYFYDLMAVIKASDEMLKGLMTQNRNDIRESTTALRAAYDKAK